MRKKNQCVAANKTETGKMRKYSRNVYSLADELCVYMSLPLALGVYVCFCVLNSIRTERDENGRQSYVASGTKFSITN